MSVNFFLTSILYLHIPDYYYSEDISSECDSLPETSHLEAIKNHCLHLHFLNITEKDLQWMASLYHWIVNGCGQFDQ